MSARPSPLAKKLQRLLEKAVQGGEKLKSQLGEANATITHQNAVIEELRARISSMSADTNAQAARDTEIKTLREERTGLYAEIAALRGMFVRMSHGGFHIKDTVRVND